VRQTLPSVQYALPRTWISGGGGGGAGFFFPGYYPEFGGRGIFKKKENNRVTFPF
jgi:hypothetical protein